MSISYDYERQEWIEDRGDFRIRIAEEKRQLWKRLRASEHEATERAHHLYNGLYLNSLYIAATEKRSIEYSNALVDEALAICGSPNHSRTLQNWDLPALRFLARFVAINVV